MTAQESTRQIVWNICQLLEVEMAIISYDTSNFPPDTTYALCVPEENTIYINEKEAELKSYDYFLSLTHEMRRLWQWKTDKQLYYADYRTAEEVDMEEYNRQPAEVDANAFASIFTGLVMGTEPKYEDLSEQNRELIEQRIWEIMDSLNPGKEGEGTAS